MSELERRLLGRLTDPNEMLTVWDMGLRAEVFEEPICAAIYNFIVEYWRHEQMKMAPTLAVIAAQFPGVELPIDEEVSTTWLAQRSMNSYAANSLQMNMMQAATMSVEDPQDAVKFLLNALYLANETLTPRHSRTSTVEGVEDARIRYQQRTQGQGVGAPTGLADLDLHTSGIYPGELAVVGGFPKTGKTFFLVLAALAARALGFTPIIFTLEMTKEEIMDRIYAMYSGISYDRLSKSKLTIEEVRHLHLAQEELASVGMIFVEAPADGDRTAGALVNRARYAGANYVIIDQLPFMEPGVRVRDLKEHHSVIMKQLKTEINRGSAGRLPCLLATQFNRLSKNRKEGIGLDSFANATEIEATCDFAFGLWRNAEMEANNCMKMELLAGRRAAPIAYMLDWHLKKKTLVKVDRRVDDE